MVEQTGGEETDKSFKELLSRIEVNGAIEQAGKQQRNKNQYRPPRQSEFYKKEWKVSNEYQISEVEFEHILRQQIRICVEAGKNQEYGKFSKHFLL
jgi:hypothetical protein